MLNYFKGKIDRIMNDRIILETSNIGFEIYMPETEILNLSKNENIKVFTHFHVREDDMRLFGFLNIETLEFFNKLISVSGVGPKVALGIISNISANDMCVAIATDNIDALKKVPGIGPKMAQKIIFELKDKVLKDQMSDITGNRLMDNKIKTNSNINEASTALQVLGYTTKEINDVIDKLEIVDESVEDIIKKVLKQMQKK